jgi:hypothetical protein
MMSSDLIRLVRLVRWGGLAGIVAGVAWAVSGIVHFAMVYPDAGTGPTGSISDYLIEGTHAVAEAGMLGALLGRRARQAPRYGWLGTVSFALAFLGSALLCAITVTAIISGDALGEAVLGTIFISGVVAVPGACCRTSFRLGRPSTTTSEFGASMVPGRGCTLRCAIVCEYASRGILNRARALWIPSR